MILDQLLDVAILAANDSKKIINEHLNKTKVLKYKGKTDLVTLADKQSEKIIRSSVDAYNFLQIAKNFVKILIFSSEKKNEKNIADLVARCLPKYLFRQKTSFELAVARADLEKIRIINNLLQKTELYLRKNDSGFLVIIQRFLLNFSKTIK